MRPDDSLGSSNGPTHRNNNCTMVNPRSRSHMVGTVSKIILDVEGNYTEVEVQQAVITEILCMWYNATMNDDHQSNMGDSPPSTSQPPLTSVNIEDVAKLWEAKIPKKERIESTIWDPLIHPKDVKCFQPQIQQA